MSSNILPIQGLKAMRVLRDERIYYIRERLLIILPASNVSSNTKFAVNPQMFQDNCSKMTRDFTYGGWITHVFCSMCKTNPSTLNVESFIR